MIQPTLAQILDCVREGNTPEPDDMRYALRAMEVLLTFDRMAFMKLSEAETKGLKPILTRSCEWQFEEYFRRVNSAMEKPPGQWLGSAHSPDNLEFIERAKQANKIVQKIFSKIASEEVNSLDAGQNQNNI